MDNLETALEMEEEEEEEGEGEGNLMSLEATWLLTQEADPSGTTLVDACNGFNELSHLVMLWTVRHCCLAGARFAFNFYKHWAQLLLRQSG